MSNVNTVTLSGRVGREPEIRYTPNGAAVANFSLAVQGYKKDARPEDQPTHWIDCTVWNRTAEIVHDRVPKGGRVCVHGRLEQQKWVDRESGGNRSKIVVIVNDIDIFDWKDSGTDDQSAARRPPTERQQSEAPMDRDGVSNAPMDDGFDDIPF